MSDFLKKRREELGITKKDLANQIGVSRPTIYKWESGVIKNMRRTHIAKLAVALQVTPLWILTEGKQMDTEDNPDGALPVMTAQNSIPLVGDIACGQPILADENIEEYLPALPNISADFALVCHGDSMVDAGLFDGDIAYIKSAVVVDNGTIACVRIGDEVTIKKVQFDRDRLVLQPCNTRFKPMIYAGAQLADVHIVGKLVGSIRRF